MPGPIAEGFVSLHAQAAGLRREVLRQVNEAVRGVRAEVEIQAKVDSRTLRSEIQRAARIAERGQTVNLGAKVDASGLRREVRRAAAVAGRGVAVEVGVKVDRGPLDQVRGALRGVKKDSDDAGGSLSALGGPIRQLAAGGALVFASWKLLKWPAMVSGISAAIGAVGGLTAGAIGLAGALGQVGGALPAVVVAGLALGQGFGVAKLAGSGLTDVLKAQAEAATGDAEAIEKYNEELAKLSPTARSFVGVLGDMRSRIGDLRRDAQDSLFPGVEEALRRLVPLFGVARPIIRDTGTMLGALANEGARMVSSGPWTRDFATLGAGNVKIIESLGLAGLSAADGTRNLLVVAQPLAIELAGLVQQGANWVANAIAAGRESGKLAGFFERVRDRLGNVGSILSDFGSGLFRIFREGVPLGDALLRSVEGIAARFEQWTGSIEGHNSLARFFADARPFMEETGRLLGAIGRGFGTVFAAVGPSLGPLVAEIREKVIPALIDLFAQMDAEFLSALVDLTTAGIKFFTVFATSTDALVFLVRAMTGLMNAALGVQRALGPVGDVLLSVISVVSAIGLVSGLVDMTLALGKLIGKTRGIHAIGSAFQIVSKGMMAIATNAAPVAAGLSRIFLPLAAIGAVAFRVQETLREMWTAIRSGDIVKIGSQVVTSIFKNTFGLIPTLLVEHLFGPLREIPGKLIGLLSGVGSTIGNVVGGVVGVITTGLGVLRSVWTTVWGGLMAAIRPVFDFIQSWVLPLFELFLVRLFLGPLLVLNAWKLAWGAIQTVIETVWAVISTVVTTHIGAIVLVIRTALGILTAAWSLGWNAILFVLQTVWAVIGPVVTGGMNAIQSIVTTVMGVVSGIWSSTWGVISGVISTVWGVIRGAVEGGINFVRDKVFGVLGELGERWSIFWGGLRDGLKGIWDGITTAIQDGIRGVRNVIQKLIDGANVILEVLPGDIRIPDLPEMHKGGLVDGGPEPVVKLQRGEYVMRAAAVRQIGLDALNAANRGGMTGRQVVPGVGDDWLDGILGIGGSKGRDVAADIAAKGAQILYDALRKIAEAALRSVPHADTFPVQIATGTALKALDAIGSLVGKQDAERESQLAASAVLGAGVGGPVGGGAAIGGLTAAASAMVNAVLSRFPGTRMTSGYRSPAQNRAVGGAPNSDHMSGRAADFVGSNMDAIAAFLRAWPGIKQVLWRVAGHFDHVHGATRALHGGLIPGTGRGDIAPLMAEPGEFVVQRPAVEALGLDALRSINRGIVPTTNDDISRFVREAGKARGGDGGSLGPPSLAGAPQIGTQHNEHHWHITHPPSDVEGLAKRAMSRMAGLASR